MSLPCKECRGKCCTFPVFSKLEFKRVKAVHGIPKDAIIMKMQHEQSYDRKIKSGDTGYVLHREDGTCPYLKDGGCSIYPLRPKVCKDYGVVPQLPCEYLYPKEALAFQEERIRKSRL